MKSFSAWKPRRASQVFLDAQKLVVLRRSIGARRRSGFDLAGIRRNGEVGNERIFCFA
jgi:hypothetical protein